MSKHGLTRSGSLEDVDLKELWPLITGGDALPAEVPDILLHWKTLDVHVSPSTGALSIRGHQAVDWAPFSGGGSIPTSVQLSFHHHEAGPASEAPPISRASLRIQGSRPADVAPSFALNDLDFLFDYQTGAGWKLSGSASVAISGNQVALHASYDASPTEPKTRIKLQAMGGQRSGRSSW